MPILQDRFGGISEEPCYQFLMSRLRSEGVSAISPQLPPLPQNNIWEVNE